MIALEGALPDVDDELSAPFWEAARRHELRVQECASCGGRRWPPRHRCAQCGSFDIRWVEVEPRGVLFSWIVAERAFLPAFAQRVPYVVGLVELDRGLRFLGNVVGIDDPHALTPGVPMLAQFEDVSDRVTLVHWRLEQPHEAKGSKDG